MKKKTRKPLKDEIVGTGGFDFTNLLLQQHPFVVDDGQVIIKFNFMWNRYMAILPDGKFLYFKELEAARKYAATVSSKPPSLDKRTEIFENFITNFMNSVAQGMSQYKFEEPTTKN